MCLSVCARGWIEAPFIVLPAAQRFEFRVLRENRRVVSDAARADEIQTFHEVLTDISMGRPTAQAAARRRKPMRLR